MNTITIREAIDTDKEYIDIVSKSGIDTLRKTYRPNQKALKNKKKINRSLKRLVALIDEKIVGTVQYYADKSCIKIIGLSVLADYRKLGISRKLIEFTENVSRKNGIFNITLFTVKETGNGDIFEKLGFNIIREELDEFSESDKYCSLTSLYMKKKIKK